MRALDLTLLTDLYELTMMQGYFKENNNETVVFDIFYRNNPCGSGYAIAAGLEQIIGGDLKCILEQGVKLLQVIFIQLTHSEVPVCLKISMFFLFHFKRLPF